MSQTFTLRKIDGLSQKEIAARLGLSEHTVEVQGAIGIRQRAASSRHGDTTRQRRKKTTDSSGGNPSDIAATAASWLTRLDRGLSPAEEERVPTLAHRRPPPWRVDGTSAADLGGLRPACRPAVVDRGRARSGFARAKTANAPALAGVGDNSPRRGRGNLGSGLAENPNYFSALAGRPNVNDVVQLPPIEERALEDGSTIRLNRDAKVAVDYSTAERLVRLSQGEAAFAVAKDTARPFVVAVAGVTVRAVGTAFNVRYDEKAVDIIVTEGRVAVRRQNEPDSAAPAAVVSAGQRATVPHRPTDGAPTVSTPQSEEIARRLAWQPRLLTFTD
jgi:transmembrane sensor